MRIVAAFHPYQLPSELETSHALSALADLWRQRGHDVVFVRGTEAVEADLAIVHVDLSVVPRSFARWARSYPCAVNDRILDIRKTAFGARRVRWGDSYDGPVFVKSVFNAAAFPERKRRARSPLMRALRRSVGLSAEPRLDFIKRYRHYASARQVSWKTWIDPTLIVQPFVPEREGEWYFTRRCFGLGSKAVSYRLGDRTPIVEGGDPAAFEWVENASEVLSFRQKIGLDYGVIDYTLHEGAPVILDVNKTPGRAYPPDELSQGRYREILARVADGLQDFERPANTVTP